MSAFACDCPLALGTWGAQEGETRDRAIGQKDAAMATRLEGEKAYTHRSQHAELHCCEVPGLSYLQQNVGLVPLHCAYAPLTL